MSKFIIDMIAFIFLAGFLVTIGAPNYVAVLGVWIVMAIRDINPTQRDY